MRGLLPIDFAALTWAEFAWLFLALGGLSLLAKGWTRRVAGAVAVALVVLVFGVLRKGSLAESASSWNRWGPVWFTPLFAAAIALLGLARARLAALAGGGPKLGMAWVGVLVAWTAILRPFDASFVEWVFVVALGVGIVALFQESTAAPRRWLEQSTIALVAASAFLAYCILVHPFGIGFPGALAILALIWLTYAVVEQGPEMRKYVARRLVEAPLVVSIVVVMSFVIMRSAPGGPFDQEKPLPAETKAALRAQYKLDDPWAVQIATYLQDVTWYGDLGISMKQKGREVNEIITTHVAPSAQLGLAALALALVIGVGAGLVSGIKQNSIFDYASMGIAMLGLALPTFVVGSFFVLIFALKLDWFNVSGWDDFPQDLILPAVTLSLPFAARLARLTRAGMLEIVTQDYVRTARAKGLSEPMIVIRHTLKGTLLPVISFLGPAVAQLLTGSLVVEKIFGVPGLGTEFINAALNRDYTVAMGLVVLFGTLLIVFNLVVDIAYGFLDPRIRHG